MFQYVFNIFIHAMVKHGICGMFIHPMMGILALGISIPINGLMTIPNVCICSFLHCIRKLAKVKIVYWLRAGKNLYKSDSQHLQITTCCHSAYV